MFLKFTIKQGSSKIIKIPLFCDYCSIFQSFIITHPAARIFSESCLSQKFFQIIFIFINNLNIFFICKILQSFKPFLIFHKGMDIKIIPEAKDIELFFSKKKIKRRKTRRTANMYKNLILH